MVRMYNWRSRRYSVLNSIAVTPENILPHTGNSKNYKKSLSVWLRLTMARARSFLPEHQIIQAEATERMILESWWPVDLGHLCTCQPLRVGRREITNYPLPDPHSQSLGISMVSYLYGLAWKELSREKTKPIALCIALSTAYLGEVLTVMYGQLEKNQPMNSKHNTFKINLAYVSRVWQCANLYLTLGVTLADVAPSASLRFIESVRAAARIHILW